MTIENNSCVLFTVIFILKNFLMLKPQELYINAHEIVHCKGLLCNKRISGVAGFRAQSFCRYSPRIQPTIDALILFLSFSTKVNSVLT